MSKLFDHINHIKYNQRSDYFSELNKEGKKSFDKFMIIKFLSMDMKLINIMNYVNQYQGMWSEEEIYKIIISLVPINDYDTQWLKRKKGKKDTESIKYIQKLYNCTPTQAYEYSKILNKNEIDCIVRSFGIERK